MIILKAGSSEAGARAAQCRTRRPWQAIDRSSDSLLRQAGVIRVDDLEEMVDMAVPSAASRCRAATGWAS